MRDAAPEGSVARSAGTCSPLAACRSLQHAVLEAISLGHTSMPGIAFIGAATRMWAVRRYLAVRFFGRDACLLCHSLPPRCCLAFAVPHPRDATRSWFSAIDPKSCRRFPILAGELMYVFLRLVNLVLIVTEPCSTREVMMALRPVQGFRVTVNLPRNRYRRATGTEENWYRRKLKSDVVMLLIDGCTVVFMVNGYLPIVHATNSASLPSSFIHRPIPPMLNHDDRPPHELVQHNRAFAPTLDSPLLFLDWMSRCMISTTRQ